MSKLLLQKAITKLNNLYPTVGFVEKTSGADDIKGRIACVKTGFSIFYEVKNDQLNLAGNIIKIINPQSSQTINQVQEKIKGIFEYAYLNLPAVQMEIIENSSFIVSSTNLRKERGIDCIINDIHMKIEYYPHTVTATTKDGIKVSNKVPDPILFGNILETTIETLLSAISLQQPDKIKMPDAYVSNQTKTKLDILRAKGAQKIVPYLGKRSLHSIFYMYLFSKYKSRCFPVKYRLLIHLNENNDPPTKEQIKTALNSVEATVNCIMNNSKIFIIPISLNEKNAKGKLINGHANCLIYRRQYNHIEHFEPHGQYMDDGSQTQNMNLVLTEFLKEVNKHLVKQGRQPVTLIHSSDVCPNKKGFQTIEESSTLFRTKEEGNGYCAAWSMFFAEMCLKNPTKTSNELIRYILTSIPKDKNKNNYLRELIRGYAQLINDKLSKYLTKLAPETNMNKIFSKGQPTVIALIENLINSDISSETYAQFQKTFDSVSSNSDSPTKMSPSPKPEPQLECGPGKRCKRGTCKKGVCQVKAVSIKIRSPIPIPIPAHKPPSPKQEPQLECGPGKRCKRGTCKKGVCQVKV